MKKSTVEEIRRRFDNDVERFSNLESGQKTTLDASLTLELMTEAALRIRPHAKTLLDVGCGAGNFTLKMLSKKQDLHCSMIDLSRPMLDRAYDRVSAKKPLSVEIIQSDIREVDLAKGSYDIILAGAVLHHLRDDHDWEKTYQKLFDILKPGGCLFVSDLVTQESKALTAYTWDQYGEYLENLGGSEYRDQVLNYIEKEDSPRSVTYQLELMKRIGFKQTEILHKNICFAAFGGIK